MKKPAQLSLSGIGTRQVHKLSIEAKLTGLASGPSWLNFLRCGREECYRSCKCCGATDTYTYRCSNKWCPQCNWKITEERQLKIRTWQLFTSQCKHVVLTQRNSEVFTRRTLKTFAKNLLRLRRSKFFKHVRGGTCSIEVTNEERGWHVHAHMLVDADWIESGELARNWGKIVGQDYAIIKVKDARETDYSRECAKYVVKGSDLAKWSGEEIWQFICAIRGRRMFFQFGSILKLKSEVDKIIHQQKPKKDRCPCGSASFVFEDERSALIHQLRREKQATA